MAGIPRTTAARQPRPGCLFRDSTPTVGMDARIIPPYSTCAFGLRSRTATKTLTWRRRLTVRSPGLPCWVLSEAAAGAAGTAPRAQVGRVCDRLGAREPV